MANSLERVNQLKSFYLTIRKGFFFEYSTAHRFAALNYVLNGKIPSIEKIKETRRTLRQNTSIFSQFRGLMLFSLTTLIDSNFSNGPEAVKKVVGAMESLKEAGYKTSTYLPLCAYALEKNIISPEDYTNIPKRGLEIFRIMKKNHPLLTSREDYLLSLLMALRSDMNAEELGETMEHNYTALLDVGFFRGNQLQFMSHILSLFKGDPRIKAERCAEIRGYLKEHKIRVSRFGDGSLALLTLLSMNSMNAVEKAVEYSMVLKKTKGFRTIGKYERLLLSTALVGLDLKAGSDFEAITGLTIQTLLIAQQVAIMAAIVVTTSSAAASSSS